MKRTTQAPAPLDAINAKLDRIIAILATQNREQDDQIRILRTLGQDWEFIGAMTGLEADTARMRFNRAKRTRKS